MRKLIHYLPVVFGLLGCISTAGCGGGDSGNNPAAGTGGSAGAAGTGGSAGASGTGGEGGAAGDAGAPVCGNGLVESGEQCDDGNTVNGDGCSSTCQKEGASEVICQTLPAGPCVVTAGDGGRLITGTVLAPDKIYRGGEVLLDASGKILFVGCKAQCDADATCQAAAATATSISCPSGVVSPGLINTHDHITYTQDAPKPDTGERYEHRHEWRKGDCGHTKISTPGGATNDQILWGELRFLFGGATSTIGSGGVAGLLRNLDKSALEEGLNQTAVDFDTFPLNDSTPPAAMCSGPVACSTYSGAVAPASIAADDSYLPHVAEGINAFAENEFMCLGPQDAAHDVLVAKSAYIHGVGLTASDYAAMAQARTSLIWSPRSNISLYGDTAIVTEAARLGVRIALGTDWLPSGSMNLLRELHCADSLNQTYFGKYFSDFDLWAMVTGNAAAVSAVDDVIGRLEAGKIGDVSIFDGTTNKDYRAIIDAEPKDVQLVLRAGKALYGDDAVISAISASDSCDSVDICGSAKRVCLQGEIGKTYSALQTSANTYAAFFCDTPTNEPTCKPTRPASVNGSTVYSGDVSATDSDGDGIPDATDNCKNVFNPIRPMDNGKQADADNDGVGDACDPCPLDANTTNCTVFNPNDTDGDGVPNATDNCPTVANPGQQDSDNDGKGDACDPCPNAPNPGNAGCPATIYQIKNGTVAAGSTVALTNQLVTGRYASGYYLQVKPGDPDWSGSADFSGLYVYDPSNTVKVGDRVTITTATVANYYSEIELTTPTATVVTSANEAPPAPVVVSPADVATGGAKAAALESVIVEVDDVAVTDIAPAPGAGESAPTNEFVVDNSLRVNDILYLISPFPVVGQQFASLSGILDFRNGNSKLELRSANDVAYGTPIIVSFSPALSFTDVGQAGTPTIPTPLTVVLSNAPTANTFVGITSSDPTSLTVVGGGVTVPAGQTSAQVLVNGLAQSASVTLTASLPPTSLTAAVRVIGAAEQPSIVSLTPSPATTTPGSTLPFVITLDIPAPAGGSSAALALNPANAGTVPATVLIPANELSATFDYVDGSAVAAATLTATLGASQASSNISIVANLCSTTHLVISEIRSRGAGGASDEFVELYNPTSSAVTLDSTWKLEGRSNSTGAYSGRWTGTGKVIASHGHFLLGGTGYAQTPAADESMSGITDATALRLSQGGTPVDVVCYAFNATSSAVFTTDTTYGCEGAPITNNPHNNTSSTATDASIERKPGGADGNCTDTNDNSADFLVSTPSNPQSTASTPVP